MNYVLDLSQFAFLALCQQGAPRGRPDEPADALQRDHLHRSFTRVAHETARWGQPDRRLGRRLLQSVTFVTGIRALLLIVIRSLPGRPCHSDEAAVCFQRRRGSSRPGVCALRFASGSLRRLKPVFATHRSKSLAVIHQGAAPRSGCGAEGQRGVFKPRDWFV